MKSRWKLSDIADQTGRVAVVTGASSGLGLETTMALCGAGARVFMACRNLAKAEEALEKVRTRVPGAMAELRELDLADLDSVRRFAADLKDEKVPLDLLINNAGIMAVPFAKTVDGFESQMGTNHLGHFALTGLLLESLLKTPGSRIVTVSSLAHLTTLRMDLDDLGWNDKRYNSWDAYAKSKLANLIFSKELARRLKVQGASTLSVACHPGYSATNLQFVGPRLAGSRFSALAMTIGNHTIAQSAALGALPTLYAATAPDVASGDFIGPDGPAQIRGLPKKVGCRPLALDRRIAKELWAVSESLTDMRYFASASKNAKTGRPGAVQ